MRWSSLEVKIFRGRTIIFQGTTIFFRGRNHAVFKSSWVIAVLFNSSGIRSKVMCSTGGGRGYGY